MLYPQTAEHTNSYHFKEGKVLMNFLIYNKSFKIQQKKTLFFFEIVYERKKEAILLIFLKDVHSISFV